jgi:hypothetical protein
MKKTILIFGSISGAIISTMFMITIPLYKSGTLNFSNGEVIGYSTMAISLSLIFFGIKSYRDNHLHGVIKFGKAFQIGLLIAVVASLFYAITWEVYFNQFIPDFMDQYAAMCMTKAKADGASPAEIQKVMAQIDRTREIYKNPILRFGLTLAEIFPVGLVIALISAVILRKKEILPA